MASGVETHTHAESDFKNRRTPTCSHCAPGVKLVYVTGPAKTGRISAHKFYIKLQADVTLYLVMLF